MNKEILTLNNEIKSKQNLIAQQKKSKPGAPGSKPPTAIGPPKDFSHEKAEVFIQMKDEIDDKTNLIEQLNDKIIVQDHELQQLRSLKGNLNRLKELEE